MNYLLLALLLFTSCLWASNSGQIILPDNSEVSVLKDDDGIVYFTGQFELNGILTARWGKSLADNVSADSKTIYLQFFPERNALAKLPDIDDVYNHTNKTIALNYNSPDLTRNENIVRQLFRHIPTTFWQYREGILQLPVKLTFNQFSTEVACDRRYYFAQLITATELEQVAETVATTPGCHDNYLFSDRYLVSSPDGYANLRVAASNRATIIQPLPNGTVVDKQQTRGNWFKVKILSEQPLQHHEGYIHQSQLNPDN